MRQQSRHFTLALLRHGWHDILIVRILKRVVLRWCSQASSNGWDTKQSIKGDMWFTLSTSFLKMGLSKRIRLCARNTCQVLHNFSSGLQQQEAAEVRKQVLLGGHEQAGEPLGDCSGDLANSVKETLDLERRLWELGAVPLLRQLIP
jgi:hypothetical protein